MLTKLFDTEQTRVTPTDPDLALVRKYALRDVTGEDVWLGRMHLANTRVDRARERFPKAYLDRFAETLPGKAVLPAHDKESLPIGRFYDADVKRVEDGHVLDVRYYLSAKSPHVTDIELGVLKDVSIGYEAGTRICEVCEKAWLPHGLGDCAEHLPGEMYDGKECTIFYLEEEAHKAEAVEGSFVWRGCQIDAQAVGKSDGMRYFAALWQPGLILPHGASLTSGATETYVYKTAASAAKEKAMEMQEALAKITTLETQSKGLREQLEAQKGRESLAKDGEAYRGHLKAEIGRLAGILKRSDSYTRLLEHMKDADAVALKAVHDELDKEVAERFPVGGVGARDTGGGNKDEPQPEYSQMGRW